MMFPTNPDVFAALTTDVNTGCNGLTAVQTIRMINSATNRVPTISDNLRSDNLTTDNFLLANIRYILHVLANNGVNVSMKPKLTVQLNALQLLSVAVCT